MSAANKDLFRNVIDQLQNINNNSSELLHTMEDLYVPLLTSSSRLADTNAHLTGTVSGIRTVLGSIDTSIKKLIDVSANTKSPLQTSAKNSGVAGKGRPNVGANVSFGLPDFSTLLKGVAFKSFPGIIKSSVKGINTLIKELHNINSINDKEIAKKLKVIKLIGDSFTAFGEVKWGKVLSSSVIIGLFAKRFANIGKVLGSEKMLAALEPLKKFADALSEPLNKITKSLTDFSEIGWGRLAFGVIALKMLGKVLTGLGNSFKNVKNISAGLTNLDKLLTRTVKILDKFSGAIGKTMKSFGAAVGRAFQHAFTGIALGLKQIAKVNFGNILKGALAIGILSVSLVVAAKGLQMFAAVSWESIGKAAIVIGGLATTAALLGKFAPAIIQGSLAIGALGLAFLPLAYGLSLLQGVTWKSLGIAAVALTGLALAAAALAPFLPVIALGALAIGALGIALIPLAYGMKMLSEVNWKSFDGMLSAVGSLALAAIPLAIAAPGLAIAGLALIPFANGIKMLSGIDFKSFAGIGNAIKEICSSPLATLAAAPGLLALGLAMIPFASSIKMLSGIDFKSFIGIEDAIEEICSSPLATLAAAPGLLALGLALIPFANGMKMLSSIDFKLFAGIGDAISEICSRPLATYFAAPGLFALGLALIPLATGMKMLSGIDYTAFAGIGNAISEICSRPLATLFAAPGLYAMGLALIPFATGMKMLSDVDFASMIGIGSVISEIALSAIGLAMAAPALLLSSIALIPFAASIGLLRAAIGEDGGIGLSSFLREFVELTERLKPDQLFQAALAITALSASIAAFGATQVAAGLGNFVGKLLNFGGDSPIEQLVKLSAEAGNLGAIGKGVEQIANGLVILAGLGKSIDELNNIPWERIGALASNAKESSPIQIYTAAAAAAATGSPVEGNIQPASITQMPNTTGAELLNSTTNVMSSPVVVNNYGGNISNTSSSAVSNNQSSYDPIVTGSAMGFTSI